MDPPKYIFDDLPLFAPFRKRKFLFSNAMCAAAEGARSLEEFDLCPVIKHFCQLRFAPKI